MRMCRLERPAARFLVVLSLLWPVRAAAADDPPQVAPVLPEITVVAPGDDGATATRDPHAGDQDDYVVSVVGRSNSLQATVQALCDQTGLELRGYRAPDRRIRANYVDMPLAKVLERLLRRESFVLGFTAAPPPRRPRLAWLRVIGTKRIDASIVSGIPAGSGVSAVFLPSEALTEPDATERRKASAEFVARLRTDERLRSRLIATPDEELVAALANTPYGLEFIQRLRAALREREISAKLARVHAQLRKR